MSPGPCPFHRTMWPATDQTHKYPCLGETRVWTPATGPASHSPTLPSHSPRQRYRVRQAHRVRGLGLDCPASQLERPRGSGPGDDRDRRRDGERAPETQKKPTHVLAPCPRPGPVSTVRPSYPAPPSWPCHLYPGHAIYPKPQRESTGAHDCDLWRRGGERTGRGPAEVAVG